MEKKSNNLRWIVLGTVIFGTFPRTAWTRLWLTLPLPKIISDFSISVSDAAWISTAYILANAVFVPVWGKFGDTAGRKADLLNGLHWLYYCVRALRRCLEPDFNDSVPRHPGFRGLCRLSRRPWRSWP
jgi:MFS family permease